MEALRAITRAVIKSLKVKGVMLSGPRPATSVPALDGAGPSLASQLESAASDAAPEDGGLLAVLLPDALLAQAEQVESAFRAGHHKEAVSRAMAALRACLRSQGIAGASEVELALMAGLTGPEFARLVRLAREEQPSREDTAFALLMLGLAGMRVPR